MPAMSHHILAKTTTDEVLKNFKTGVWTYATAGWGRDFYRTGTPADFPSPDAAFYDVTNRKLAYFEFKPETETKRGILTGVGQSIAYLQKSNLSFLVAPKKLAGFDLESYLDDLYTNQIDGKLPTGLILYDNSNPKDVVLKHGVSLLTTTVIRAGANVDRFWAKHQDLPVPLFHLILHYYYLKKVGAITEDPFAKCFKDKLISPTIMSSYTTQIVYDVEGNAIKTVAGGKNILFMEKKLISYRRLSVAARNAKILQDIDTNYTGDNYYNSIKKNYLSFMRNMHMIDSTGNLTESGFNMYNLGLVNGPTSKIFYDYFIRELLTTGHHLDLLFDYDQMKCNNPTSSISTVLSLMEADYLRKGNIKTNPARRRGVTSTVEFLKYERILWKALGLIEGADDRIQWKKITEICSLPEL